MRTPVTTSVPLPRSPGWDFLYSEAPALQRHCHMSDSAKENIAEAIRHQESIDLILFGTCILLYITTEHVLISHMFSTIQILIILGCYTAAL